MRTGFKRRKPKAVHQCGDDRIKLRRALHLWFDSPLGARLLEGARAELGTVLPNLFGYHLVQVGQPAATDLTSASRIRHRVVLDELARAVPQVGGGKVQGAPAALPFAGDSVDVLLLAYTLEFEDAPHQVLREVDRVLIPEGHVVILGFNPWSLWGVGRALRRRRSRLPWCGHFYSLTRVKDWLALLGFDTVHARSYFFRPPFQGERLMSRLRFFEGAGGRWWPAFGGGYILVARKKVMALTPLRPRWRPRRALVGGLTEPTLHRDKTEEHGC